MNRPDEIPHLVTRFAPSPTGRLHIGHAWSALRAHDAARAAGGWLLLRIEDIDGSRSRPEHVDGIIADLAWLGIAWDGPILHQSTRLGAYAQALERLKATGLLYPCFCTRADIQAQWAASLSAPHGPEGALYPGTCRNLSATAQAEGLATLPHAWRIDMAKAAAQAGPLRWEDVDSGPVAADPLASGDVVLARKDAPASYHLAATIDDAFQGVNFVLRGQDLFAATHVHRLLQALLNLPTPLYRHHPILVGADGKRLAKRDRSLTLAELREQGIDPAALAADLRAHRFPFGIRAASA